VRARAWRGLVRALVFGFAGFCLGSVVALWCLSPVSCRLVGLWFQWSITWWPFALWFGWLWLISQPCVLFLGGFAAMIAVDRAAGYAEFRTPRRRPPARTRGRRGGDVFRVANRGELIAVNHVDEETGELVKLWVKSA